MKAVMIMYCNICPRKCGIDRGEKNGVCGVKDTFKVARAAKHFWEEPPVSGTEGSGTVFFSGCNLKCVYCQNYEISHRAYGKEISDERLMEIFDELIANGAHNINLVNPTHYAERLAAVLQKYKSTVPVVYNSSGYERVETLEKLEGLVDIYLPDFKYIDNERSGKYSKAPDYPEAVAKAIKEMKRQQNKDVFDEKGIMQKGVIIRHLVLPKNTNQSLKIISFIKDNFGEDTYLSLMAQYTPCGEISDFPELQRRIRKREYEKVVLFAEEEGFSNLFLQQLNSSDEEFIPPFDLTGV